MSKLLTLKRNQIVIPDDWNRDDMGDIPRLAKSISTGWMESHPLEVGEGGIDLFVARDGRRRLAAYDSLPESVQATIPIVAVLEPKGLNDVTRIYRRLANNDGLNFSPLEESKYIVLLIQLGAKQKDIAKEIGKTQAAVSQMLKVSSLPEAIKNLIGERRLAFTSALALVENAEKSGEALEVLTRRILEISNILGVGRKIMPHMLPAKESPEAIAKAAEVKAAAEAAALKVKAEAQAKAIADAVAKAKADAEAEVKATEAARILADKAAAAAAHADGIDAVNAADAIAYAASQEAAKAAKEAADKTASQEAAKAAKEAADKVASEAAERVKNEGGESNAKAAKAAAKAANEAAKAAAQADIERVSAEAASQEAARAAKEASDKAEKAALKSDPRRAMAGRLVCGVTILALFDVLSDASLYVRGGKRERSGSETGLLSPEEVASKIETFTAMHCLKPIGL